MPPKKQCFTKVRMTATAKGPKGSVYQGCAQPKTAAKPKKRRVQRESTPVLDVPETSVPDEVPKAKKKGKLVIKKRAPAKSTSVDKSKADKKARIQKKVIALGKSQVAKKKLKKQNFAAGELERSYGLTKAQANAMDPLELFGKMLPEMKAKFLIPSERGGGVKVGDTVRGSTIVDTINKIVRYGSPRAKFNSKNMNKLGNQVMKVLFNRIKMNSKLNYHEKNWTKILEDPALRARIEKRLKRAEEVFKEAGKLHSSGTYEGGKYGTGNRFTDLRFKIIQK